MAQHARTRCVPEPLTMFKPSQSHDPPPLRLVASQERPLIWTGATLLQGHSDRTYQEWHGTVLGLPIKSCTGPLQV